MNEDLPLGWINVRLGDVAQPSRPRRSPQHYHSLPYIGMEQVEAHTRRLLGTSQASEMKSTAFHFQPGDVLYGRLRPYLNKVWQASFEGLCSSEFIVLPSNQTIESQFLAYYLSTHEFVTFANQLNKGDRPRVSFEQISEHFIPIPPLHEQCRIVKKLETIIGKIETCRKRLERIPAILKRFRQSVLAAACSGNLTADWRVEHPQVESGQVFLARIRESRLASAQSKRETEQIVEAFNRSIVDDSNISSITEFPSPWAICTVGMIGTVCNGGTPSRKSAEFWGGSIPWVSSGEVRNNAILNTREGITEEGFENTSIRLLPSGTVLLAMIGEGKTRGQTAVLKLAATINQNVAAIIINNNHVLSEYLWYWFQFQYSSTREVGSGSGPQALNSQRVRELPFVLPPLAEQEEIVRRVESLFTLADQLEVRYKKGKAYVDKLTQSILAKAFRGELVPQDPNDEPAEKLLAGAKERKLGK